MKGRVMISEDVVNDCSEEYDHYQEWEMTTDKTALLLTAAGDALSP